MLFNSFEFLVFFPIVCLIYFLLPNRRWQNGFLLVASYYFYMNWKPVYAILIASSTLITYFCGLLVEKNAGDKKRQKVYLISSLLINFSILFIFKYFNFINESVFYALEYCGLRWTIPNLDILLPVGISFYTFQAVGYSIDVYRGTIKAERNFGIYALFVSFFPQLVAGPIERAKNLLPQFHEKRSISYGNVANGFKMMLWGYFMKLCVADRVGLYVDAVYNNIGNHNGSSLLLATVFFSFQIYCDFAGYSLIAKGAAKVMGFELMDNFKRPYFSKSIKEFWKRWHISLSSWFMDYLYIPLGGSRVKLWRHLFNLAVTFVVSGLWHGANWTFLVWGMVHSIYLIIETLWRRYGLKTVIFERFGRVFKIAGTFCLAVFAWIFFRAGSIGDAFDVIGKIFTEGGRLFMDSGTMIMGGICLIVLIIKEICDECGSSIKLFQSKNMIMRCVSLAVMIAVVLLFGVLDGGQFIYFQF